MRFARGWFADAREGYQSLWQTLRARSEPAARGLADEALGFLLQNDIGTGRADRLKQLLAEAEGRPRAGSLEGHFLRARQAVYLLEHVGAQSVTCGPLALNAIQKHTTGKVTPVSLNTVPASYIATGIPLSEVQRYATDHYQLALTAARRTEAEAAIPVPAVLHASEEHYVALTQAEPGRYFMVDRARRFASWVSEAAVNAMSSGHFLIPSGEKTAPGFALLAENEARHVFGRDGAHGTAPPDESSGPDRDETDDPCDEGMPAYAFHAQLAGLIVNDTPLRHRTPFGPQVAFELVYQDMDTSQPVTPPAYTHTGGIWLAAWVGYVVPVSGTLTASSEVRVHDRHGGVEVSPYEVQSGVFGPNEHSFSIVKKTGAASYERTRKDGTKEIYSVPDVPAAPTKLFLSSLSDPSGNTVTFQWDAALRLVSVTDALGQVTTLQYAHPGDPFAVTSVTDPFSRTALIGYDTENRINSLTDQIGLTSTFTYQADGFLTSMTTPYGTTQFRKLRYTPGTYRTTEAEDPQGDVERIEFTDPGPIVNSIRPAPLITVGGETIRFQAEYNRLQFRNSWHWTKEAWHAAPGDYSAAINYRWFTDQSWLVLPVMEAKKLPLEERVWYSYPGMDTVQSSLPWYPGMGAEPSMELRMLDANTPQLTQTHRNRMGQIIKSVDPLGRTVEISYDTNGLDVTELRQTTGGISERLTTIVYNAQRLPVSVTDASGQTSTATYNARGQLLSKTTPAGTTAYTYDANGFLTAVDGPLPGPGDTYTFTWDPLCRMTGAVEPDGYAVTMTYDAMDRRTRRTFPDGTYEEVTWHRLDVAAHRDRAGRTTAITRNALRQPVTLTDPAGRVTRYEWCRCGDLRAMTDPMGRTTRWRYDLQGRLIAKEYPDGSKVSLQLHPATGWVTARTDDKGQVALFDYHLDGQRRSVSWANAAVPTPPVTWTYDAAYGRPATMTDSQGVTAYAFHPPGVAGARQLASIDGPWANDTITFSYDAAGRLVSRAIDGVAESATYDEADRLLTLASPLGNFTAAYDGVTDRPASLDLPGGGKTLYSYHPNTGDRRLQKIRHEGPGGAFLAEFTQTWDATGRLTGWTQQQGAAPVENWSLTGDAAGQLTGVTIVKSGSPNRVFGFEYDAAGNRTAEVIDGARTESFYNALNQQSHTGATLAGTTYEWDGADRLTAVVRGTLRSEFSYDGHGRRVRVVEKDGAAVLSDRRYLWCVDRLCEERSADGGTVLRRFYHHGQQDVAGGGAVSLYRRDHLESVRVVTSTAGAVLQRIDYDPWGRQTVTPASPAPMFTFTGLQHHPGSGLHLALFRAYQPSSGRWISRDPIGEPGGQNLYAYANNSPAYTTDRLGLSGTFHWYGNWGGPGWANGGWNPESGPLPNPGDPDYRPPLDDRDRCYEGHDRCINACGPCENQAQSDCIEGCDYVLAGCLLTTLGDRLNDPMLDQMSGWERTLYDVTTWPANVAVTLLEAGAFSTLIPWLVH